ncbi:MAG: hypothetical protein IJ548_02225 [Paludibacteraceae bacterium]|nr:hypothetical protein [Paludibacteraceae bacterium]MBQ8705103.1 hypothetical protein [Paludibacteraceae bacterium]
MRGRAARRGDRRMWGCARFARERAQRRERGLERITACFLGIANVKECSMFPRDINRVAP